MMRGKLALAAFGCLTLALLLIAHVSVHSTVTLEAKPAAASPPAPSVAATNPPPPPSAHPADARKAGLTSFVRGVPNVMRGMLNPTVDPCDDFHQFACGTFEKDLVIPPERTGWSYSWDGDGVEILGKIHKILMYDQSKPGFYYRACMNTPEINRLGTTPLKPWLALTQGVNSPATLAHVVAKLHMTEVPVFFSWFVGTDDKHSARALLYLDTGGLSLPDASYYVDEKRVEEHKAAFLQYIEGGLKLSGFPEAEAKTIALTTLTIEIELASHTDDWGEDEETYRYNATSISSLVPKFDWKSYLDTLGHADLVDDRIFLTNPPWFRALNKLLEKFSMKDLSMYLTSHLVMNVSPLLTDAFLDNNLELDRNLYGIAARTPRWKKCTRATRHALPFLVSQLFVDRYFPVTARKQAMEMMESLREAFRDDLRSVAWMTNTTRAAAIVKLDKMFFEVASPSQWPQYGFLTMVNTYFDNAMRASEWRTILQLERLRHPVQRHFWDVTPVTVNAFYYNGVNGVFLPVGILQPPFFDAKEPLAHNYGSIGSIMGHELSHSLDSTGSQFNADGERRDWWDQETLDEYDKRKQCVRDYYSQFEIYGEHVDGANTLDEDIADIGGLKIAYRAFLLAEKKQGKSPTIFDKRMFWTSFAQTWCGVTRKETALVNLVTDQHAPDKIRIIGALSQNDDFAKDFSCPVGSKMNPANKCVLW